MQNQYYQPYQTYQPYQQQQSQQAQPVQSMQNGGFMTVRSEEDVLRYPLAPGTFATFRIEGTPFVVEKAMGFSQLEGPQYRKYQLTPVETEETKHPDYALKDDLKSMSEQIDRLESEIRELRKETE